MLQQTEIQAVKQRFGIIGNTIQLNRAIEVAMQVANTDLSVLITGESGVGKENFPQIIHQYSHRKHKSYIAVNCGAIPEGTIDSELFGHQKGAFTSATSDREGYFETANDGTIFLDEVGELPLSTQVRLLRVLETGEFMRVGSSKVQKTNVRVVAATNLNMKEAIQNGKFREDLFYRLNAVPIIVPPLRERKDDILLLFRKFANDFSEKYKMPPIRLTEDAQKLVKQNYWKGNIRQLKNTVEQISVIEQQRDITGDIVKNYLDSYDNTNLPALIRSGSKDSNKTFNNEREILYEVLFDMKRDMNELKRLVADLMAGKKVDYDSAYKVTNITPVYPEHFENEAEIVNISAPQIVKPKVVNNDHVVEDTTEYVETTLSLEEVEKDMILKALERNKGKRKAAANDLKISERTLYRKIKEYGMED